MSRLMSRRSLLGVALASATASMLAACSAPASPTPAPSKPAEPAKPAAGASGNTAPAAQAPAKTGSPVTLEFTSWGTDNGAWQKLADGYMAKTPGVTIKVTPVPGGNEYYQKLQTAIAGGAKPDVASFQGWEWQVYADKGVLAEIDGYMTSDKFTAAWPDFETVKIHTMWKGKRYHFPMQMAAMLMLYAKKPFQEKGIKPPTDDWTFEEFLDIAKKLTDTSGSSKKFGLQANGNWVRDIHWLRSSGKDEFDSFVEPKKSQFNQPEIVDIVQIVASDVYNKLKVAPTPADMQGGANTIEAGNAAMKYEGPWYFPTLTDPKLKEQKKDVPFDAVLMPKGKDSKRRHRGWSEGVNILKGDKVDAAWGFSRYMADEDGQKIYSELSGRIPNNPQLAEKFWIPVAKERFGVENAKAYLKAFELSMPDVIGPVPRSKIEAEAVKPDGWDPLIAGTAQAKDVLPKVDAKVQALLDAANKK
jgi:multiple sugar transport system substrate-binding protein